MDSKHKSPPVICTDDAWFIIAAEPPLTVQTIKEKMLSQYEGTNAALWWAVGDHEVYHHETEIGEIFGQGYDDVEIDCYHSMHSEHPGAARKTVENVRYLMKNSGGPLTSLIKLCREAGMEFFPRVRMNSHYDIASSSPSYGRLRRENPELLIGHQGKTIADGTVERGISTGLNYAFPKIRNYMYSIITELFEKFDIDGLELDFMRHPAFFRPDEAFQNSYLMTDLVSSVRQRMTEISASRGRAIRLGVRVPPTMADSRRIGLDVAEWIENKLVDVVVVGGGFIPFDAPVDEFVSATRGTDIQIYGCIEALRHIDEPAIRALANLYLNAGASGVYLYNFFTMPFAWNSRVLSQISNLKSLEQTDKRYSFDQTGSFINCGAGHSCAFRYASPPAQLPVTLRADHTGEGPIFRFQIADDLESAMASGSLRKCTLLVKLDNFESGCQLDIKLNGIDLPWDSKVKPSEGWTRWARSPTAEHTTTPSYPLEVRHPGACIEYNLDCPPITQGQNQLEIHLITTGQALAVVLSGIDVIISYHEK